MKQAILYIHGKGGNSAEVEQYKTSCEGFDVIGVDYQGDYPWAVRDQIRLAYDTAREKYERIILLANSIGAYFAMHALQHCVLEKALFISPVLDMERLISKMMGWANVSEQELQEKGEIPTDFGETLSWRYLCFTRENPVSWHIPTEILYGEKDNLISRQMIDDFVAAHEANLTVMAKGEHWFHTEEQLAFLKQWLRNVLEM